MDLHVILKEAHERIGVTWVHPLDLDVVSQVGTDHPQRAGRGGQVGRGTRARQPNAHLGARLTCRTTVVRGEAHRRVRAKKSGKDFA